MGRKSANTVNDIKRMLRTLLFCVILSASTLSGSMFAPSAKAAEGEAGVSRIEPSGFLKANGTVLRNNYGTGNIVNLRGTNLGGWLLQEGWMSPLGVKDEWTLRETLTSLHGAETAESLIKTYGRGRLGGLLADHPVKSGRKSYEGSGERKFLAAFFIGYPPYYC